MVRKVREERSNVCVVNTLNTGDGENAFDVIFLLMPRQSLKMVIIRSRDGGGAGIDR